MLVSVALVALIPQEVEPSRTARAQPLTEVRRNFEVVGRHDLNARGMNAGLAIAGDCAYVGSRSGDQGVLVLDIADPERPAVIDELPFAPGSTARELRADAALDLLVVMNYRFDPGSASPNGLDLYAIDDCRSPRLVATVDFGDALPHEFFLWKGTTNESPRRVLAYVAMWGYEPNLRVVDLTEPEDAAVIATWDAAPFLGFETRLHSVSVTPDGGRAFLADFDQGLMVLDTSALAAGAADTTPRLLTEPATRLVFEDCCLHSAVPIPDSDLLLTTQENYGAGACPYGRLRVVDAASPDALTALSIAGIAENDPSACGETSALDGAFTAHDPLVVENLAFVTWYAGGLRVFDLGEPLAPREVAAFVPEPLPAVDVDDFELGSYPIRMWSSPIIRDGLIYVVDIRNGLFVVRYDGPRSEAVAAIGFAEGNATT